MQQQATFTDSTIQFMSAASKCSLSKCPALQVTSVTPPFIRYSSRCMIVLSIRLQGAVDVVACMVAVAMLSTGCMPSMWVIPCWVMTCTGPTTQHRHARSSVNAAAWQQLQKQLSRVLAGQPCMPKPWGSHTPPQGSAWSLTLSGRQTLCSCTGPCKVGHNGDCCC